GLTSTEMANGFVNRFLIVLTKRSRIIPRGKNINAMNFDREKEAISEALKWAKADEREFEFSTAARELWEGAYRELINEENGQVGELVARGPAHVLRLSLISAVLARKAEIELPHLEAGLEVWNYCRASIDYLF